MVLELSNTEMLLLIHLISFIHFADTPAFPSISTLAGRINQHPRTVQRTINKLISKGVLKRKIRAKSVNDKGLSNLYSFEPLIEKLLISISNNKDQYEELQKEQGERDLKTVDQLVRIAAAGGGLRLSASTKTVDQLVRIAAAQPKIGFRWKRIQILRFVAQRFRDSPGILQRPDLFSRQLFVMAEDGFF